MNEDKHGDQAFRADSLHGRQPEMTWAGALSFMRRRYTREIAEADVVVSGVPFDAAVTNRPGTRFGPAAVRAGSAQLGELAAFPWGFDPFDHLAVADWGDCFLDSGYPEQIAETVEKHARDILAQAPRMLTLGGDHFITYPLLRAHAEIHGPLSLIQFDAHPDTWPDDNQRIDHGTMVGRAVNDGIIDPRRSVQIGIRTHAPDFGIHIIDAPAVHGQSTDATTARIREVVGDHPVYISFDIDSLDPAFAPGTGTPVAGGLSSAQALAILRGLGDLNHTSMDVVEVAPAYDHSQITAIAAATVAHDWLCLLADRKRRDG